MAIIAEVKTFIPCAPPGKNVTKYHKRAINCTPLMTNTLTYPCAPEVLNVQYNVPNIDAKYKVVNGSRSIVIIPEKCSYGPLNKAKLPINVKEPHVKDSANFCGRKVIMGMPTKNAREKKTMLSTRKETKTLKRCW
mmetsp:Transcript_21618/g.27283  ORF Transcript_21618/g.27283 Transcript_21618/m.27283 type:complete len:136 (-) Transcript_21618:387-794(-)